jgi:N-methylhydantoinase B
MTCGEVFRAEMPGAGGYGDPLTREVALIEEDVRQGKITVQRAREIYGAEIDPSTGRVEPNKTAILRRIRGNTLKRDRAVPRSNSSTDQSTLVQQ